MTLTEGIGFVTQVLVAVGVVANVVQNLMNARQIDHVKNHVDDVKKTTEVIHLATNSMKDDLVAAVKSEAFQAGKIEQAQQPDSSKVTL